MSEVSQETHVSEEFDSNSMSRRKKVNERRKLSSASVKKPENKDGSELLCDRLQLSNKRRLQSAFVGLAFLVPYTGLCLTYPEWTGHVGSRLSLALFSFLGQAALLTPFLLTYLVLSCAGFRSLRKTNYWFAVPLVVGLDLLVQRWSRTGGWLGRTLDNLVVAAVGPGGAWLFVWTAVVLLTLAFFPKAWGELVSHVQLAQEHLRETLLSWKNSWENSESEDLSPEAATPFTSKPPCSSADGVVATASNSAANPFIEIDDASEPSLFAPIEKSPTGSPPIFEEFLGVEVSGDVAPVTVKLPPAPAPPQLRPMSTTPADFAETRLTPPPVIEPSEEDPTAAVPRARSFELPPLALLDDVPQAARHPRSEDKSQALLDALDAFGVKAKLLQIVRGPAVTRYELQPARGVKVSKFTSLTNDIALALASTTVRIEAPIPGKSAIGIEIANEITDLVVIKDILSDPVFTDSKGLTVALGKDISGRAVVTDLQKMPHLLVAGTTGSGKSVCVNGLILSLLYRFTPDQLQLMMVDPKQVELSVYEDIPHLVGFSDSDGGEIIVDPKKAALALHQVVELMEQRYTMFAESRVRNLAEYNAKSDAPLPWFVVIIDELADLMMVASKSVETSICRIAQKARAAGIHLVLATQRPSADVITGLIKVNIPSRAAFAVSSQVDSRVILDSGGAEHLLGKGDMLFLPVDASDPKRIQGAFVNNEEISRVVEFWKGQRLPDNRIEFELKDDPLALDDDDGDDNSDDALMEEALRVTLNRDQASASMLQTELKVGYARARRLLMAMEKKGWVGPAEGSKPRKILYTGPAADHGSETA